MHVERIKKRNKSCAGVRKLALVRILELSRTTFPSAKPYQTPSGVSLDKDGVFARSGAPRPKPTGSGGFQLDAWDRRVIQNDDAVGISIPFTDQHLDQLMIT